MQARGGTGIDQGRRVVVQGKVDQVRWSEAGAWAGLAPLPSLDNADSPIDEHPALEHYAVFHPRLYVPGMAREVGSGGNAQMLRGHVLMAGEGGVDASHLREVSLLQQLHHPHVIHLRAALYAAHAESALHGGAARWQVRLLQDPRRAAPRVSMLPVAPRECMLTSRSL